MVDALESSAALRRAVTDPGTPEGARRALVHGLLDGKVDKAVVDLVAEAATLRWAGGRTFAAALERQAVRGQLIVADRNVVIWRTPRTSCSASRGWWSPVRSCATRLADRSIALERRQELVGDLLEGRATDATSLLAQAGRSRARTDLWAHDRGLRHAGRGTEESCRGDGARRDAAVGLINGIGSRRP